MKNSTTLMFVAFSDNSDWAICLILAVIAKRTYCDNDSLTYQPVFSAVSANMVPKGAGTENPLSSEGFIQNRGSLKEEKEANSCHKIEINKGQTCEKQR